MMFAPIRGRIDMDVVGTLFGGLDVVMREAALFAAFGFALIGLSDLAVDTVWLGGLARRRRGLDLAQFACRPCQGELAIFVPAWDEAAVIGPMLRHALTCWGASANWRIYVGLYPNDPGTAAAAAEVQDERIRLVTGPLPGPTTKADCLNRLWQALLADEAREGRRPKAVLLHDAEDVVHPGELRLFETLIDRYDLVQLPVLPLPDENSRWIGGHYADEFAEAHGKELVVRGTVGAGLPSAGVGCAFSREALGRLAPSGAPGPFDADSLTEDYELGLRIAEAGGRSAFVRALAPDGTLIATREFFPGTLRAAVAQKARWMTGIALCGWDRLGWSGGWAERWMRLRDRQSLLAALLLFTGYLSGGLWLLLKLREGLTGDAPAAVSPLLHALIAFNVALLAWRLSLRALFTGRAYGWREGLRAVPRAAVGNLVAMLAAAAAFGRYNDLRRRSGRPAWGKTEHRFPATAAAT
jgi:bacteriophage N4 adsorption protein B